MTVEQKRDVLTKIAETQAQLEELQRIRFEIAQTGTASASLASGGGSKSYTRLDLNTISAQISLLARNIVLLRRLLAGQTHLTIRQILKVYG